METNIQKLTNRIEQDGIIDIKVFLTAGAVKPNPEELAGEVLEILDAPRVEDPDFF